MSGTPRRLVLLVLALGNFAVGTGALVLAGVLPMIAHDVNVSAGTAGQLVAIYALAYAVAAPIISTLASGIPRRTLLALSMLVLAAGSVLGCIATSFPLLVVARVVAALGGATFTPASAAVAAAIAAPERRGAAIALVFGGFSVATVLGVPIGTYLGAHASWRVAFGLVAALAVLAGAGVLVALRDAPPATRVGADAWLALLRRGAVVRAAAAAALQMAAQFTVFTYVAPLLGHAGFGPDSITFVLLGFGIASIAGTQLGGVLGDRLPPRLVVSAALAGLAIVLPLVSLAASSELVVVVLLAWGAVGFGFQAPQQKRIASLAPSAPILALALNASALYVGTSAGAALGGALSGEWGLGALGIAGGILAALGLLAALGGDDA